MKKSKYNNAVKYAVANSNEDRMVRVPREMYEAIAELIKKYPQYGWKGPSEFVRDAIRRYVEEIMHKEMLLKRAVKKMPQKMKRILAEFMGEEEAEIVYSEIMRIDENDPNEYINKVIEILEPRLGGHLAEILARRLVEVETYES